MNFSGPFKYATKSLDSTVKKGELIKVTMKENLIISEFLVFSRKMLAWVKN